MSRQILVFGKTEFRITIPDDARLTFGPWSPPTDKTRNYGEAALKGTLRIYADKGDKNVIGVFSGVTGYRDLSLIDYEEKTAIETGSFIWKSDKKGYFEEKKITRDEDWTRPQIEAGDDFDELEEEEF